MAAFLDVLQLALAIRGEPIGRLALLVASLYAVLALLAGASVALLLRAPLSRASRLGVRLVAAAVVGWPSVVIGTYVNVVHLPALTHPVTLAGNLVLLAAAGLAWWLLARSPGFTRLAASARAIVLLAFLCTAATAVVSTGRLTAPVGGGVSEEVREPAASDSPSVFVITIDTLRFDRTVPVSGRTSLTPNLDRLAAEGRSFDRAYAQASWTKPSVASLFTSLFPSAHQANLRRDRLGSSPTTIPELMSSAGYRTAVFSANPWIAPAFGFQRGVHHFYESEKETFTRLVMLLRGMRATDRLFDGRPLSRAIGAMELLYGVSSPRRSNCDRDRAIAEAFEAWLDRTDPRPAFAYLHLMSPHIPYHPPEGSGDFDDQQQVELLQATDPLPSERHDSLVSLYDATVEHADAVLGEIIEALVERGLYERSVVVVTADHGEEFYEHGRWGHGKSLYDELVRVPLVMRGPGIPANERVPAPAMLVDVMPTLAALLKLPSSPAWQGSDLASISEERDAFAELIREGGLDVTMVVRAGKKYLETVASLGQPLRRELYDLRADPGEQRTLEVAENGPWARRLAELRERAASGRVEAEQTEIDDAAAERLNALGYAN